MSKLPECMMPDGAEPCSAYTELYQESLQMKEALRQADIAMSILLPEIADRDMAKSVRDTLGAIDQILYPARQNPSPEPAKEPANKTPLTSC